jgi:hypothetical protein
LQVAFKGGPWEVAGGIGGTGRFGDDMWPRGLQVALKGPEWPRGIAGGHKVPRMAMGDLGFTSSVTFMGKKIIS